MAQLRELGEEWRNSLMSILAPGEPSDQALGGQRGTQVNPLLYFAS